MRRKSPIKAQSCRIKETAFFPITTLPKYIGFCISTASPPKRRRKNPDDRKHMKGAEYHQTLMLKQK